MATLQDITAAGYFLHGIDNETYKQGKYLASDNRVVLKHDDEAEAIAEVFEGNNKYNVVVWNNNDRLEAKCDCSAPGFCAHAVATALSL